MKRNRPADFVAVIHISTIIKGLLAILATLLLFFAVSGLLTSLRPEYRLSSESVNTVTNQFSGKVLFSLIANENHYFNHALPGGQADTGLGKQILKASTNISLDDPRSLLGRELPGFSIFDNQILVAGKDANYTNMPYESAPPLDVLNEEREAALQNVDTISEPDQTPSKQPSLTTEGRKVVEIYHTHNRESYLPYLKGVTNPNQAYHSKINVTKLGAQLQKDLEEKGIGASLNKTDIQGQMNKKGLTYGKSYLESRTAVKAAMAANQDIQYLIDIHRDSKRKKDTTRVINGKTYARIAFVIGGKNTNYEKNAELAGKLHKAMEKKYPGLSWGISLQKKSGQNGIYNQDLSGNALLIEIGGVDNTFEEMFLTTDAFADVFSEIYWNTQEVSKPAETSSE